MFQVVFDRPLSSRLCSSRCHSDYHWRRTCWGSMLEPPPGSRESRQPRQMRQISVKTTQHSRSWLEYDHCRCWVLKLPTTTSDIRVGRTELRSQMSKRSEERRVGKECRSRWSP